MKYYKFDKRLVERNITSGLITKEEYDEYLAKLPDVSDNAEVLNIPLPGTEEADESEDKE